MACEVHTIGGSAVQVKQPPSDLVVLLPGGKGRLFS